MRRIARPRPLIPLAAAGLATLLAFGAEALAAIPALAPFAVDPGDELRIHLEAGRLTLRASDDAQVHVDGVRQPGDAVTRRRGPGVEALRLGDPDRWPSSGGAYALRVPASTTLSIHLGDAALDLEGIAGERLSIRGGRGEIRVRSAAQRVSIASLGGAIDLDTTATEVRVDSLDGDIRVLASAPDARLVAQTLTGGIEANVAQPGRLRVSSLSGGVLLRLGQGEERVSVETVSGDIRLVLAPEAAARIEAKVGGPPLRVGGGLPLDAAGAIVLGDGGWPIRLTTVSGRLTAFAGTSVVAEREPASN